MFNAKFSVNVDDPVGFYVTVMTVVNADIESLE